MHSREPGTLQALYRYSQKMICIAIIMMRRAIHHKDLVTLTAFTCFFRYYVLPFLYLWLSLSKFNHKTSLFVHTCPRFLLYSILHLGSQCCKASKKSNLKDFTSLSLYNIPSVLSAMENTPFILTSHSLPFRQNLLSPEHFPHIFETLAIYI